MIPVQEEDNNNNNNLNFNNIYLQNSLKTMILILITKNLKSKYNKLMRKNEILNDKYDDYEE